MKLILSCEHAVNRIPEQYQYLFSGAARALESHKGYDPGAMDLFLSLVPLADFSRFCRTGRLLVEVNRSPGHPQLFSRFTRSLSFREKKELLEHFYFPYRNAVEGAVGEFLKKNEKVLHLSIHSFTPVFQGELRQGDIGLLYDPSHKGEKEFCRHFKKLLKPRVPELSIRFNYPYLGKADGLTTYLRRKYPEGYTGIELEVSQHLVTNNRFSSALKEQLFQTLQQALEFPTPHEKG